MIEALAAVLVLSIGLLGLAMLQAQGMKFNTDSYLRTQATFLAYEIMDRMRANKSQAIAGAYNAVDDAAAETAYNTYKSCKTSTCSCLASDKTCSAANLAKHDLGKWYEHQTALLPRASENELAWIQQDGTNPNLFTITMRWRERDLLVSQTWQVEL